MGLHTVHRDELLILAHLGGEGLGSSGLRFIQYNGRRMGLLEVSAGCLFTRDSLLCLPWPVQRILMYIKILKISNLGPFMVWASSSNTFYAWSQTGSSQAVV